MEAWSTSQRAAASSARSREKREKYEGVWVMLEVGEGRGKQCFETLWKKFESTYSYIRVFYLFVHPFFSPFFFALFKFYGSLYKGSLGDVYRDQCFEGVFLYRKFESLKVVNMGGMEREKKKSDIARSAV